MDLWDEVEIRETELVIINILPFSIPLPDHVSTVDILEILEIIRRGNSMGLEH